MAVTLWDKIIGFSAADREASGHRSQLEEEVVSLFEQLRMPVLRYVISFRIAVPDAEEIAQEVFLSLFRHLERGKSKANLQGWIFRVAHNLSLKHRARSRQNPEQIGFSESFEEFTRDREPGPEERIQLMERQQRLLAIVQAMPEQDRWCLSLRAEGLRYREIAEILSISLGSVANSLERSLSRLTAREW
jgi:RNA polymerase sigma-70 factor, ECF subfamily